MMKKSIMRNISLVFFAVFAFLVVGCSTKKNTVLSRGYQAMTTKFNVYYNGEQALIKAKNKIEETYKPDYTRILCMYAVSDESTKGAGKGDAARCQEKCQSAIKLHSMRKKPQKKPGKMKDPKYAEFYAQEEFNPMMDDVWMMLGKAKYYANDYLAASATFTYVQNHFSVHKDLVLEASLWKAKALKELGWMYEAEEVISNIDDEQITYKLEPLYNSTMAEIKLSQGEYKEALPYLIKAIPAAENRTERMRFYFIIGQIYQHLGKNEKAYDYYDTVARKCPVYEMEFNARMKQSEVYTESSTSDRQSLLKKFTKLAKGDKNKDYLDQIYYAIGNIYLNSGDTAKAIENYKTSAEKSTRNGVDKAVPLIKLGRLYWERRQYIDAEPCMAEASSILSHEHPDYDDVSSKSLKLTELKQNYDIVHLQDSLIALARGSEADRMAAIAREIKKVEEEEKRAKEREEELLREQRMLDLEIQKVESQKVQSRSGESWYFYSATIVQKGKAEFRRKFGDRRLEDNWVRRNKNTMSFDDAMAMEDDANMAEGEAQSDSTGGGNDALQGNANLKDPNYYLRQLPMTEEQQNAALAMVEDALYKEAVVYDEKIEDYDYAIKTFEEYIRRFGGTEKTADAYFYCYRISGKIGNESEAARYKDSIVALYPQSKYAQILNTPDYQQRLEAMNRLQDSLYAETYALYLKSEFGKVIENADYMANNYSLSGLMPKFQMLKALSFGKMGQQDSLKAVLETIAKEYAKSDVAPMAKDIIALMEQGGVAQAGTAATLANEREQMMLVESAEGAISNKGFTFAKETQYHFYIISKPEEVDQNMLLFNVATYNFTKFLVKDFDIKVRPGIVSVSGLENLDEALWYAGGVEKDSALTNQLKDKEHTLLVISDENSKLIGRGYTIEQYEAFYRDTVLKRKDEKVRNSVQLVGEEKALDEISKASTKIDVKEGEDLNGVKTVIEDKEAVVPAKEEGEAKESANDAAEQSNNDSSNSDDVDNKDEVKSDKSDAVEKKEEEKVAAEATNKEAEVKKEEKKKDLPKYKGLYTFDRSAKHYFAILVAKGVVNTEAVIRMLNEFNNESAPLLNLKADKDSGKNLPAIITVGMLPDSKTAIDYLKQINMLPQLKQQMENVVYKNVIITKDNLEALKSSGNVNAYMELFKRGYLGK